MVLVLKNEGLTAHAVFDRKRPVPLQNVGTAYTACLDFDLKCRIDAYRQIKIGEHAAMPILKDQG